MQNLDDLLAGGEPAFEALLRAWCGRLAVDDVDQVAVFSSPGSPGYGVITGLAAELELFDMWTDGEPSSAAERGWYVDAVHF